MTQSEFRQVERADIQNVYGSLLTEVDVIEKWGPPKEKLFRATATKKSFLFERALAQVQSDEIRTRIHSGLAYTNFWKNRLHRDFIFLDKDGRVVSIQRIFLG